MSGADEPKQDDGFQPSRRTFLYLGAAAASTVVTIRPALAQTAGSVLNCEIPVPGPHAAGNYIAPDGTHGRARHGGRRAAADPAAARRGGADAAARLDAAGRQPGLVAGLRQLYPAAADGDERLHLLRLAADAALS